MRKIVLSLIVLLALALPSANAETISISAIDWCPQLCPGKPAPGYIIDTVQQVFANSPYRLNIRTYPWTRAIQNVRIGKSHALLSPAKQEAPDLRYPRNGVGIQRMCFFTPKASQWTYTDMTSLRGLRIGTAADTSIEILNEYIKMNRSQFQFMPYNKTYIYQSLKKLDAGRLDTFLFTHNTVIHELNTLGLRSSYRSAGCVYSEKIYMAFSPDPSQREKVTEMMAFFDHRMDQFIQNGEIEKIMRRYGLEDWSEKLQ